jgi:transcriptional regulator with XRE-family HTH domain
MSTETIGEKLRQLRAQKKLPLRKVAAMIDIDVAILSKMERGIRMFTKNIIMQLAKIYEYNVDDLLVIFLSDKILYELQDEELESKALKVAEQRMKHNIKTNEKI